MKRIIPSAVLCGLLIFVSVVAFAQTEAKKYDDPQWKRINYVDYKQGKFNRAREIINKYHAKASEKAGTPGPEMVLEMNSGEWDIMAIWGMKGGISDMDWEIDSNDIKWRKAMNEIAGSPEEAQAIIDELQSLINRSSSEIARVR
jgi:hypothetical protein